MTYHNDNKNLVINYKGAEKDKAAALEIELKRIFPGLIIEIWEDIPNYNALVCYCDDKTHRDAVKAAYIELKRKL